MVPVVSVMSASLRFAKKKSSPAASGGHTQPDAYTAGWWDLFGPKLGSWALEEEAFVNI